MLATKEERKQITLATFEEQQELFLLNNEMLKKMQIMHAPFRQERFLNNYRYSADEMALLLTHYLEGQDKVGCLIPQLDADIISILPNLQKFNLQRIRAISEGKSVKDEVLVPINLGQEHWVLLDITYAQDAITPPNISYFDYLGQELPSDVQIALKSIPLFYNSPIITLRKDKREDGYNCGLWVIELARAVANGCFAHEYCHDMDLPDINPIRAAHKDLISHNRDVMPKEANTTVEDCLVMLEGLVNFSELRTLKDLKHFSLNLHLPSIDSNQISEKFLDLCLKWLNKSTEFSGLIAYQPKDNVMEFDFTKLFECNIPLAMKIIFLATLIPGVQLRVNSGTYELISSILLELRNESLPNIVESHYPYSMILSNVEPLYCSPARAKIYFHITTKVDNLIALLEGTNICPLNIIAFEHFLEKELYKLIECVDLLQKSCSIEVDKLDEKQRYVDCLEEILIVGRAIKTYSDKKDSKNMAEYFRFLILKIITSISNAYLFSWINKFGFENASLPLSQQLSLFEQACLMYDEGNFENSANLFRKLFTVSLNSEICFYYVRSLVKLTRFKEALSLLDFVEYLEPESYKVPALRGMVYFNIGDVDEAIINFENALKLIEHVTSKPVTNEADQEHIFRVDASDIILFKDECKAIKNKFDINSATFNADNYDCSILKSKIHYALELLDKNRNISWYSEAKSILALIEDKLNLELQIALNNYEFSQNHFDTIGNFGDTDFNCTRLFLDNIRIILVMFQEEFCYPERENLKDFMVLIDKSMRNQLSGKEVERRFEDNIYFIKRIINHVMCDESYNLNPSNQESSVRVINSINYS